MIEDIAIVSKIEGSQIYIKSQQRTACNNCVQKENCSSSILDHYFKKRDTAVDNEQGLELKMGDHVVVGVQDSLLLRASILLYLMPLLGMFFTTFMMQSVTDDAFTLVLSAISGLGISLVLVNHYQYYYLMQNSVRPLILKKI